jgi:hypothetical protein
VIYAWKKGLKTISYYQHTEAATTAKKELGMSMASAQPTVEKENLASMAFGASSEAPAKTAWNPEAALVDDGIETMVVGEVCEDCST